MNAKTLLTIGLVGAAGYLLAVKLGYIQGLSFGGLLPAASTDEAAAAAAADAAAKAKAAADAKAVADAAAASGNAAAAAAAKAAADKAAADAAAAKVAADKAAAEQAAALAARNAAANAAAAAKAVADAAAAKAAADAAAQRQTVNFSQWVSNTLGAGRHQFSADTWNAYYTQWSGVQQTADLFPPEDRGALLSLTQYLANRTAAGLSGYGMRGFMRTGARPVPVSRGRINYRRIVPVRGLVA